MDLPGGIFGSRKRQVENALMLAGWASAAGGAPPLGDRYGRAPSSDLGQVVRRLAYIYRR